MIRRLRQIARSIGLAIVFGLLHLVPLPRTRAEWMGLLRSPKDPEPQIQSLPKHELWTPVLTADEFYHAMTDGLRDFKD